MTANEPLVGIFVGGSGSRMGGVAKGLLRAPDSSLTLIERTLGELRAALPRAAIVLVGAHVGYTALGLDSVADAPGQLGPLGGLLGLLLHAKQRSSEQALALACDLPFIERALLARLAHEAPEASAVVACQGEIRNPLVARYAVSATWDAARAAQAAGKRSLQAVLDQLGSSLSRLQLSPSEEAWLNDWDTPEDMRREPSG